MQLQIFKTMWGHNAPIEAAIAECARVPYDGIEGVPPTAARERRKWRRLLDEHGLLYIVEVPTTGDYVPVRHASVDDHLESLQRVLDDALQIGPLFANIVGGCDAWSIGQSVEFFGRAIEVCAARGLVASFETHRSRSLFHPWRTLEIAEQLPELKLTCDYSHWCVVCERLLDSEPEVLALCARRAHHIHGRVGYAQGAQVPHPAAPEYRDALQAHERWWRQIWDCWRAQNRESGTLTAEFGPDGYNHELPFTRAPVADLSEINAWMANRQRANFARN